MKKLTIGITTYNSYPFQKILFYTLQCEIEKAPHLLEDIEFFLVDDCSSDQRFLEECPDFIRILEVRKHHGGPSEPRNRILEESSGEYICFIDGDDTLVCSLEALVQELSRHCEDVLVSDVVRIDKDGHYLPSSFIFSKELFSKEKHLESIGGFGKEHIYWRYAVHQTGIWSIYRRTFLQEHAIRYVPHMRFEDNLFLYTILLHHPRIAPLSIQYYGWRIRYDSFTRQDTAFEHRIKLYAYTLEMLEAHKTKEIAPYIYYSVWNQTYGNVLRLYGCTPKTTCEILRSLDQESGMYSSSIKSYQQRLSRKYIQKHHLFFLKISFFKKWAYTCFQYIYRIFRSRKRILQTSAQIFKWLPIHSSKVFFLSLTGTYADNLKYTYLEMKKSSGASKIRYVFPVKDASLYEKNKDFISFYQKSRWYFHFYTAHTVYTNSWMNPELSKRKGQKWLQLWHGFPYKRLFTDITITHAVQHPSDIEKKKNNILKWDAIDVLDEVNASYFTEIFPNVPLHYKEYARIRYLREHKNNEFYRKKLLEKYGLDDKKYILYAPTYRPYTFYLSCTALLEYTNEDECLLFHPHPLMKYQFIDGMKEFNQNSWKVLQQDVDIQEILLIAGGLITDYSSICYDAQVLYDVSNIRFYQPDKALYEAVHGLYQDPIAYSEVLKRVGDQK